MSLVDTPMPRARARGSEVRLEPIHLGREREFLSLVRRSKELHEPWVHPPSTPAAFRVYVERLCQPTHAGYFVCQADGTLAGVININEIVRGAMCSGALGYYGFAPSSGRGLVARGLVLVVKRAFTRHGLHRLEANIQESNDRSREVVRRLGFRFEGVARRLLKVGGSWRDHERWALTVEDWRAHGKAPPVATLRVNESGPRPKGEQERSTPVLDPSGNELPRACREM